MRVEEVGELLLLGHGYLLGPLAELSNATPNNGAKGAKEHEELGLVECGAWARPGAIRPESFCVHFGHWPTAREVGAGDRGFARCVWGRFPTVWPTRWASAPRAVIISARIPCSSACS